MLRTAEALIYVLQQQPDQNSHVIISIDIGGANGKRIYATPYNIENTLSIEPNLLDSRILYFCKNITPNWPEEKTMQKIQTCKEIKVKKMIKELQNHTLQSCSSTLLFVIKHIPEYPSIELPIFAVPEDIFSWNRDSFIQILCTPRRIQTQNV